MSEQEMNSYRLTSLDEPTDEMLALLMKEVAEDAMLLFRLKKGKLVKKYINTIPEWAYPIYNVDF